MRGKITEIIAAAGWKSKIYQKFCLHVRLQRRGEIMMYNSSARRLRTPLYMLYVGLQPGSVFDPKSQRLGKFVW